MFLGEIKGGFSGIVRTQVWWVDVRMGHRIFRCFAVTWSKEQQDHAEHGHTTLFYEMVGVVFG